MIVLDTQVISQLQRGPEGVARLGAKLVAVGDDDVRVTVISPYEQMRNRLGKIKLNRQRPEADIEHFEFFLGLIWYYIDTWTDLVLPFDRAAVAVFKGFPSRIVQRAGVEDACIGAIAIANNATVLTENLRDFQIIPGLSVDRW
jgi:predicted nucleic acid-binding protein